MKTLLGILFLLGTTGCIVDWSVPASDSKAAAGASTTTTETAATTTAGEVTTPAFPPTPTDGIKNGDETDLDCGGASAPKCAAAKGCTAQRGLRARPPTAAPPPACLVQLQLLVAAKAERPGGCGLGRLSPSPGRFPLGYGPYGHADLLGSATGDDWFQFSFQEPEQLANPKHPYAQSYVGFGTGAYAPHWAVGARCVKD